MRPRSIFNLLASGLSTNIPSSRHTLLRKMDQCHSSNILVRNLDFISQYESFSPSNLFGLLVQLRDVCVSGNAIASEESVRVTPSLRSQKGMIWSKEATNFDW